MVVLRGSRPRFGNRERILAHLCRRILAGALAPGARIPSRDELARRFAASKRTVQQALDLLERDGLVRARGPAGTFVSDRPGRPAYGLVFEFRQAVNRPWSKFWKALAHEAPVVAGQAPCDVVVRCASGGRAEGDDFRRLIWDVRTHRLAGLIFAGPPFVLEGTAAVQQADMPRVGIMAEPLRGVPAVWPDAGSFLERAMDYLRGRGRRRLGLLWMSPFDERAESERGFRAAAEARGLLLPPFAVQCCHPSVPWTVANVVRLLMRLPPPDRPDGLILSDDNLLEHAVAGLVAAGVRVPDDVEVVAHCNYPLDAPAGLPVRRLGFDCREILRRCVEVLDCQRLGREVPRTTLIPAVFEEEFARSAAAPRGPAAGPTRT